jgi:hypothetical protein
VRCQVQCAVFSVWINLLILSSRMYADL